MTSRVGRVAVVAGVMAFGVTEGASARAADPGSLPPSAAAGARPGRRTAASTKKTVSAKPRAKVQAGLIATLPGFDMMPDGGSRLFVALTRTANVTEKRDARSLTYVIHGAHVVYRNNENALETVHFNTPVTRARLLQVRGDLVFSIELRAESAAVWRLVDGGDGSSLLQIDFPKGSFLPAGDWESQGPNAEAPLPRPANVPGPPPPSAAAPGRPATPPEAAAPPTAAAPEPPPATPPPASGM